METRFDKKTPHSQGSEVHRVPTNLPRGAAASKRLCRCMTRDVHPVCWRVNWLPAHANICSLSRKTSFRIIDC